VRAGIEGTLPEAGGSELVELAPTGRRFLAMVVDLLLAAVSLLVPTLAASALQSAVDPDGAFLWLTGTWLLGYVWFLFYGAAFVALWGGTPGLLLAGLQVTRVWDGHARPSWREALKRARFLAAPGWLIPGLNVVVVLVRLSNVLRDRPYHHSMFDSIAETVVVRRPSH